MVPSVDQARILASKGPLFMSTLNIGCVGFFCAAAFNFREMMPSNIAAILLSSWFIGFIFGMAVKYRINFSVKFGLIFRVYVILALSLLFGGASVIVSAEIVGLKNYRWALLSAYQAIILASAFFAFYIKLVTINSTKGGGVVAALKGSVDFKSYIIRSSSFNKHSPKISTMLIAAAAVNIPFAFKIFTESQNNTVYFAMPMLIIGLLYLNSKYLSPQIACLYLLRKYEKQTGRSFINADYEKIQELRRTFFLSRWLMKDYRPASNHPKAA